MNKKNPGGKWDRVARRPRHCGSRLWSWRVNDNLRCSAVLRPIPCSLTSKQFRWCRNAPPNDELAAKKFLPFFPTPFGVVVCEASGVERRSGNGRPIFDCCGAHSTSGCRCEDAGDVRKENGKEEKVRRACRVGEATHPGPQSRVNGSTLQTSVLERWRTPGSTVTFKDSSWE